MPLRSIHEALRVAEAGDTIIVKQGIYREGNLLINKPVFLTGENYPILDGAKLCEVVSVKASHTCISGFKITHSGVASLDDPAAIKVYNQSHVSISDNILEDNFFGIYIYCGKKCAIKNNRIAAYATDEGKIGNGIHCWKSDSLVISGNKITGHRDGIYFEFVTNSVIWRNVSHNNIRYGLHFMFSNNDAYITNIFRNNGVGVAVMFTHGVKMINNTFEQNWGESAYGLMLKEISDSYIYGNRFTKNTVGIFMEGNNRMRLEKNKFCNNGWALKIQASCIDNEIHANNFMGNTFDTGTNGALVLNDFSGNYWDRYTGYDLDKNGLGDIPYHPLSLFSVISEKNPPAMLLFRSFMVDLLDRSEKLAPSLTPENFVDHTPLMRALPL